MRSSGVKTTHFLGVWGIPILIVSTDVGFWSSEATWGKMILRRGEFYNNSLRHHSIKTLFPEIAGRVHLLPRKNSLIFLQTRSKDSKISKTHNISLRGSPLIISDKSMVLPSTRQKFQVGSVLWILEVFDIFDIKIGSLFFQIHCSGYFFERFLTFFKLDTILNKFPFFGGVCSTNRQFLL